jgi:hypothetical protein
MSDNVYRPLNTIQKRNRLNEVYALDNPNQTNGASHRYGIVISRPELAHAENEDPFWMQTNICFQDGPANAKDSTHGVLDVDLLEIVRDRLIGFQNGAFPSEENKKAIEHIEIALMYLNKRAEDRAERGVLGKNKV